MAAQAFGGSGRENSGVRTAAPASGSVHSAPEENGPRPALETADRPRYSVVVPVRDEEASLTTLYARLLPVLEALDGSWELLLVDDGSRDGSYQRMLSLHREDPRVKVIRLSRNFGQQAAITAGLELSSGDAIVVMDGDLQHPPELIADLVARWREGYAVVYGVMTECDGETWFKRPSASLYYRILSKLADIEIPPAGDFRLVDRRAADAFLALPERNRYVRGMFSWIGFNQTGVPYCAAARHAGSSKYTLGRMLRLATQGIVAFSSVPLRLVLRLGFLVSALAILQAAFAIVGKVGGLYTVPGWASLVVVACFLGGFQLIVLGVMGQYMAMMYDEVKRRPMYIVRDMHGFRA